MKENKPIDKALAIDLFCLPNAKQQQQQQQQQNETRLRIEPPSSFS